MKEQRQLRSKPMRGFDVVKQNRALLSRINRSALTSTDVLLAIGLLEEVPRIVTDDRDGDKGETAELIRQESPSEKKNLESSEIPVGGLYGTNRDMTFEDVKEVVDECRKCIAEGRKVTDFYRNWHFNTGEFSLGTLRYWHYNNPKFS